MRLSSIKLSGFKSFVDPTNFQVPSQLVGVVGPNGCGKSNIIDAVRWVLGESKASELRGESMQDVIFNGSTNRKPSGRASVELVFDNAMGKAAGQWSEYAEIAVKRTLTRDGTSTYYINGQAVRRRDIQDIFLGTGLGPRAYAIIGQGMISRIIESRPEELRVFLEEAAGVSRYKERRRETENRIHDTHENLVRVEDILRELNTNLEKLQAQAEVATQYHRLSADQEEKQKLLWLLRKREAEAEQKKHFADIEKCQMNLEEENAKLRHIEMELEQMRQVHYQAGDKMHQAQGDLYQTNAEIGSLEAQIKFVVESRTRLQAQIQSLSLQREQWQRQSSQFEDELSQAHTFVEELLMRCEESQEKVAQQEQAIPALENMWRDVQTKSMEAKAKIAQMQQQIEMESAHQRNASNILNSLQVRRERLVQEKQGMQAPDATHLHELNWQLEERRSQLEEMSQKLQLAEQTLPQLEQQKRAAQEQAQHDAAKLSQLDAKLAALQSLQDNVESQGKIQPWLAKHELSNLPKIWQKIQIDAGWETALESVLRERTTALEVSNLDWAKAFFNDVPPTKLALFTPQIKTAIPTPQGLQALIDKVKINDSGIRGVMQDWLHGIYLSDDALTAFQNRHQLPEGACFVTKQGHWIGASSVRFYAADSEQEGLLARQNEIEQLHKQSRAQTLLAEEAQSHLVRSEVTLSQAHQQLQDLRAKTHQLTQSVHELQLSYLKNAEVQERFNQRSTQIQTDLGEIAEEEQVQLQARAESEARFEHWDIELAQLQESHESIYVELAEKEQALSDARSRLRDLELQAQENSFSEKTHRAKIEELKRNIATALEQAAQLYDNMEQGQLELQSMDEQAAQAGLQSLLEKRQEQEKALSDARHELDQLTQKLRHHEDTKVQLERGLQPVRDRIVELQLKEQAARLSQEQYDEQLRNFEVDEKTLEEKLHDDIKPQYLQAEVTRLGNAIAALGAVNLAALEELAQAEERKKFLDAQYADLSEAIQTLQDAIQKIDMETRDLLQGTFDRVNKHFGELFPILFGGGQAKLIMTGDEILDSGVQVMAQPPGKKNATIHLLSGGEKALTATALVFSIFQLNPAPFCLLDEVDAPLDDSNTERFCNMVKRMSSNTQFLFISHNKIAMEMAQQLIGVTMQEQGVSRIVAVDMESAVNLVSEV